MQGERPGELAGPDVWETCRELIPAGSVFAFLAVHREALFPAGMFADMYPSPNGRPSMPPQVLAVTVVLQALYGLADHDAVQALRCDLRWKAACGLGLLDPGFHPSLLTYFRRRLARSGDPGRLFSTVKEVVAATGALAGKHRRALDSTVLDDAVATQDTVTQLVAAIRRVIREVPGAAVAAAAVCGAHDYRDLSKPKIAWDDEQARAALVSALVNDALGLLDRLPAQPEGPAADAAGLLALVAGQDVEPAAGSDGTDGRWRIARQTAADRVVSVTDPDARHIHKNRARYQDGFKAHVAFEPETGLFTAVKLTGGSGPGSHDAAAAAGLLAGEQEAVTVLGDAAYGTGELRARLRDAGHAAVIKPPPLQPAVPGGFTGDDFTVDGQAGTVTCPAGRTVPLGRPHADGTRLAQFKALCAGCPLRRRCTTSKTGRVLSVHPQHALLAAAATPPLTPPGKTSTAGGGPRSNGPSPGWSPEAAAESPTAPSPATTSGSTTGPPPSTSAGWPTSDSPAPPTAPGHSRNRPARVSPKPADPSSPGPRQPAKIFSSLLAEAREHQGPGEVSALEECLRRIRAKRDYVSQPRGVVPSQLDQMARGAEQGAGEAAQPEPG